MCSILCILISKCISFPLSPFPFCVHLIKVIPPLSLSLSVTINSIGQMQWGLLLASAVQAKVSNQITVHVTQVMWCVCVCLYCISYTHSYGILSSTHNTNYKSHTALIITHTYTTVVNMPVLWHFIVHTTCICVHKKQVRMMLWRNLWKLVIDLVKAQ